MKADKIVRLQDVLLQVHAGCDRLPTYTEDPTGEAERYRLRIARVQMLLTEAAREAVEATILARRIERDTWGTEQEAVA